MNKISKGLILKRKTTSLPYVMAAVSLNVLDNSSFLDGRTGLDLQAAVERKSGNATVSPSYLPPPHTCFIKHRLKISPYELIC